METFEALEILAQRARREIPPATDVRVNHLLNSCRREESRFYIPAWPAVISALAACILLMVAMHISHAKSSDSVAPLFAPMQVEMP